MVRSPSEGVKILVMMTESNRVEHIVFAILCLEAVMDDYDHFFLFCVLALPWGRTSILPLHTQRLLRMLNIDRRKLTITNTFLRRT